MKHILKIGLPLLLVISLFSPLLFTGSTAHADDPPGFNTNIDLFGNNPNLWTNLYGNNPNVWINGEHLGSLSNTITNNVLGHTGNGNPNSNYSGASTGLLPPLGNIAGVAAVAPDQYDTPYIGWQGYFCPHDNTDPSVYTGSGCGGTWGVCDGYPDMWARRQIAGIAPEFAIQKAKLDTVIEALAKVITVTENNNHELNGDGVVADIKDQIADLVDLRLNVSVLEEEQNRLNTVIQKQQAAYDQKLATITTIFSAVFVCLIAFLALVAVYIWRLRKRMKSFGY